MRTYNKETIFHRYFATTTLFISLFLFSCQQAERTEIAFDPATHPESGKGYILVATKDKMQVRSVDYSLVGKRQIFEGDILVTTRRDSTALYTAFIESAKKAHAMSGYGNLWTDATIVYYIDPKLPKKQKAYVRQAIADWRSQSGLTFRAYKAHDQNCVIFTPSKEGPSSDFIGMKGGIQYVNIDSTTSEGNIRHEIGHVVGLWHEHSRPDRNEKIKIRFTNVQAGMDKQFNIFNGITYGEYDYASIMHYGPDAFAIDLSKPTITTIPAGIAIGLRERLSRLDVTSIKKMYGLKRQTPDRSLSLKKNKRGSSRQLRPTSATPIQF